MLEERVRPRGREPVDVTLRRVEQPDDGVEVTVGASATLPTAQGEPVPTAGDVEGVPHRPEDRLRADTWGPRAGAVGGPGFAMGRDRARHVEPRVDRLRQPAHRCGVVAERGGMAGFEQDGGQQLVAGPLAPVLQLLPAQQPTEPAEPDRVALPQRRQHEVDRALRLDPVVGVQGHLEHGVDEGQQRTHGDLVADRALARRGQHRHAVGHEDPPQCLVAPLAADDDGHVAPGDPVEEVSGAQPRRDVRRLLGRRPQEGDLDTAAVAQRLGRPLLSAAERPDAGGDRAADPEQGGRLPVCGAQEDRRRLTGCGVGPAEVGPPGGQDAGVGAPERLDRHVRVTDEHEVRTGGGEHAQQPGGGGGGAPGRRRRRRAARPRIPSPAPRSRPRAGRPRR